MRGWLAWISMGLFLALAFALGSLLLGLCRLSPRFGCRLAGSALAVAALNVLLRTAARKFAYSE